MAIDGPLRTVKVRRPAWEAAMVHSLMSMAALAIVTISCARPAVAEATTLRAAKQYGLGPIDDHGGHEAGREACPGCGRRRHQGRMEQSTSSPSVCQG